MERRHEQSYTEVDAVRIAFIKMYIGSVEIVKPYGGMDHPGEVRITEVGAMGSVLTVIETWTRIHAHVCILGRVNRMLSPTPGVFLDIERRGVSWVFVSKAEDRMTGDGVYPISSNMGHFDPWVWWNKSCIPVDVATGAVQHSPRDFSLRVSAKKRLLPSVSRFEAGYDPKIGNVVDYYGSVNRTAFSGEMVAASSLGGYHVFLSEKDRDIVERLFWRPYLSHAMLKELMSRSKIIHNGVDLSYVRDSMGDVTIEDRIGRVGSFYAIKSGKGVEQVLGVYADMLRAKMIKKVVVTHSNAPVDIQSIAAIPDGFLEYHPLCKRAEYLGIAQTAAVAVWNSSGESSPIAPVETAYMGVVPVLPNREWFTSWDGGRWPLVYDILDEVPGIIQFIMNNLAEWSAKAKAWAEGRDGAVFGKMFVDHLQGIAKKHSTYATMSPDRFEKFCDGDYVKAIRALFSEKDVVQWSDVRRIQLPGSRFGLLAFPMDIPAIVGRVTGWEDDLSSPYPIWRSP